MHVELNSVLGPLAMTSRVSQGPLFTQWRKNPQLVSGRTETLFFSDCREWHGLGDGNVEFGLELPTLLNLSVFAWLYAFKFISAHRCSRCTRYTPLCKHLLTCLSLCTYVSVSPVYLEARHDV